MKILNRTPEETEAIMQSWKLQNGVIVWKRNANANKKIGDPVGFSTRKSGHKNIFLTINKKFRGFVYARVVWLLHYGVWPDGEIDHIDCNSQNDLIENLRIVNRNQNCQNTRFGRTQKSFKGTFQDKRNGKWHCQLQAYGKVYGKYGFATQLEAYEARQKLAQEFHGKYTR